MNGAPKVLDILDNETDIPEKNRFRLVIVGSSQVGKTAIINRFIHSRFDDKYMPTIEDFYKKIYSIRGENYLLEILDTSGLNPFPALQRVSLLAADLYMLVFSVVNPETFQQVKLYRQQILDSFGAKSHRAKIAVNTPMIFVGNKMDLEDRIQVTPTEILDYVKAETCCEYVATSAKSNQSVSEAFQVLFAMAGLPVEMAPELHRRLSAGMSLMYGVRKGSKAAKLSLGRWPSECKQDGGSRRLSRTPTVRRRLSNYGVLSPDPRRPSIRTDLERAQKKLNTLDTVKKNKLRAPRALSQPTYGALAPAAKPALAAQRRCTIL